ncbi:MAG: sugar phosphate isomerase/epimerase [Lachnospiraceae bacterium]|nr:sugar phosphate isomerase/epimerase [Lachnospiraceae bacterium]
MKTYEKLTGFADEISPDLETQIRSLKQLKMHYVEMRGVNGKDLIYHDNDSISEIRTRLKEAGIQLSAVGSPIGKIGITDPFEKHYEDFKRAVEIAHKMGTSNIRMFSFYVGERTDAVRDEVLERLGKLLEYAKSEEIVLLHENEKDIYGEKAAACRELFDALGCENFLGVFDFANFVQVGQDTLEAYELLKEHIAYVHVKDAILGSGRVVPAGYGDGHVGEILQKMFAGGYRGFLSVEPHLTDFEGFEELERNAGHSPSRGDEEAPDGFTAFSIARQALLELL